jgi:hypothetical protein
MMENKKCSKPPTRTWFAPEIFDMAFSGDSLLYMCSVRGTGTY